MGKAGRVYIQQKFAPQVILKQWEEFYGRIWFGLMWKVDGRLSIVYSPILDKYVLFVYVNCQTSQPLILFTLHNA
jgi:hypothetical protein